MNEFIDHFEPRIATPFKHATKNKKLFLHLKRRHNVTLC